MFILGKNRDGGKQTLGLPETVPILALQVLYPRKPLSPGQTTIVGNPRVISLLPSTV